MKHLKTYITAVVLLVGLGAAVLPSATAVADPKSVVCTTLGSGSDCGGQPSNSISLNNVIAAVVNILSMVIGVAAVIMIMVGGFRYVTSGGDSSKTAAAKNTIIYAIVGLIIAILAQAIVRFVLNKVT